MDLITEQILLEAKIIDAVKKIAPTAQNAVMKGNINVMKRIAKSLPKKDFSQVEKEATRKLPGFRQKYKDMQRIMIKNVDAKGIEIPAAIVGAVGATIIGDINPDLISLKLSEATKNAQKRTLFPGSAKIVTLILFLIAILLITVTRGEIFTSALTYLFAGVSLLMALLGKLLEGAAKMIEIAIHGPQEFTSIEDEMNAFMNIP